MLKKNRNSFYLAMVYSWLVMFCLGCASQLRLNSTPPQAKVDLIKNDSQGVVNLGETPILIAKNEISDKQINGPYILRITKEGFATRDVVIASLSGLQLDFNVELKPDALAQKTNNLIDELFDAQNLAQKGDYKNCLEKLDKLQKEFPEVSAIYEMRGSVYMVRGEYSLAVQDLKQAVSMDPESSTLRTLYETAVARNSGNERKKEASP